MGPAGCSLPISSLDENVYNTQGCAALTIVTDDIIKSVWFVIILFLHSR